MSFIAENFLPWIGKVMYPACEFLWANADVPGILMAAAVVYISITNPVKRQK